MTPEQASSILEGSFGKLGPDSPQAVAATKKPDPVLMQKGGENVDDFYREVNYPNAITQSRTPLQKALEQVHTATLAKRSVQTVPYGQDGKPLGSTPPLTPQQRAARTMFGNPQPQDLDRAEVVRFGQRPVQVAERLSPGTRSYPVEPGTYSESDSRWGTQQFYHPNVGPDFSQVKGGGLKTDPSYSAYNPLSSMQPNAALGAIDQASQGGIQPIPGIVSTDTPEIRQQQAELAQFVAQEQAHPNQLHQYGPNGRQPLGPANGGQQANPVMQALMGIGNLFNRGGQQQGSSPVFHALMLANRNNGFIPSEQAMLQRGLTIGDVVAARGQSDRSNKNETGSYSPGGW